MRVGILGPVAVGPGEGAGIVPLGSHSQRLVLAVLAARTAEVVSADVLADALWGDNPPRTADTTLRAHVSRLRARLGDALAIRPGGYSLDFSDDEVDARHFEGLLERASTAQRPEAVAALLEEALGLWRGPAFGDLADVEALRGPARRLEELRRAARENLAAVWAQAGQPSRTVAAAEELVAEQPLREGTWALLIEALAGAGRAPEALRAYQRAAAALAEAGLVPSERLRAAEAVALSAPAGPVLAERPLPARASTLVGRDADLAGVEACLASARLVTLCGPGGVGKTRLAMAVAERAAPRYRWGARLVALAPVTEPGAVATVVADALGLSVEAGGAEAALAGAGNLDLLIVLDNCEHVIEAAARAASILLSGGGRVRLLATSRERLAIDGEQVWPLEPLACDGDDPPARRMFVERARGVRPDAVSSPVQVAAADRIVHRLDGLPLAIEMAAARAATMPVVDLAERLDDLAPLTSTRRDTEDRHRTLAAVVEWSAALLDPDDRDLLEDLSVFASTIHETDVAAVTGRTAPLEALGRLAERSLLITDVDRGGFRMLATIRDHAARRLAYSGRGDGLAAKHAQQVTALVEAADRDLRSQMELTAAQRLDALIPDLRAAQAWASRRDRALAVRLCAAVHLFAQSRMRDEPLGWAEGLADDLAGEPGAQVVLAAAAQRAVHAGDLGRAEQLAELAVDPTGADACVGLEILADVALFRGDLDRAESLAHRVLLAAQKRGDDHAMTAGRSIMALAAAYARRFAEAEALLGGDWDRPVAPSEIGWMAYTEGEVVLDRDPPRALALLERAVALADSVGNRYLGGVARVSACSLRARVGDPDEAADAFATVIEQWSRQGARILQLTTLRNLVVLLARIGRAPEAAELLGAVERDVPAPTFGEEAARLQGARRWVHDRLGPTAARHLAAGAVLTLDEAADRARGWLER